MFDSGSPVPDQSLAISSAVAADDFYFAGDTLINHVAFWAVADSAALSVPIYYAIFDDIGGIPSLTPTVAWTEGAGLVRQPTGRTGILGGDTLDEYMYSFGIAPFTAQAGSTYWLALRSGDPGISPSHQLGWVSTASQEGSHAYALINPNDGGWLLPATETYLSFQLGVNEVPEPATLSLFGLGLAALAGYRRVSKQRG